MEKIHQVKQLHQLYSYRQGRDKNIDILVKYTGLSDAGGIFGARVAYVF